MPPDYSRALISIIGRSDAPLDNFVGPGRSAALARYEKRL